MLPSRGELVHLQADPPGGDPLYGSWGWRLLGKLCEAAEKVIRQFCLELRGSALQVSFTELVPL